jgi:hypothetical protein
VDSTTRVGRAKFLLLTFRPYLPYPPQPSPHQIMSSKGVVSQISFYLKYLDSYIGLLVLSGHCYWVPCMYIPCFLSWTPADGVRSLLLGYKWVQMYVYSLFLVLETF